MEQSSFIKGRQILDGPFLLNEIVAWRKASKNPLLIFKVDFEKVFDSVSWDYLMEIMQIMGFGSLWCGWIMEMLSSATASVLVNGSPSREFHMYRGLRQGDPLSPFLFLLAIEGLHVALIRAQMADMYRGISIGGINMSHLFYADDAVLFTPWDQTNAQHIIHILRCFFMASGLKINLLKSKVYGVGFNVDQVSAMAHCMGCVSDSPCWSKYD